MTNFAFGLRITN